MRLIEIDSANHNIHACSASACLVYVWLHKIWECMRQDGHCRSAAGWLIQLQPHRQPRQHGTQKRRRQILAPGPAPAAPELPAAAALQPAVLTAQWRQETPRDGRRRRQERRRRRLQKLQQRTAARRRTLQQRRALRRQPDARWRLRSRRLGSGWPQRAATTCQRMHEVAMLLGSWQVWSRTEAFCLAHA